MFAKHPMFENPCRGDRRSPLHRWNLGNIILGLFPQLYSSRLDIGCLLDIRCLGKLLFGEMRIEQTVLALPKDIGCFRNIRCLKKIVEQTCVFYPVPMCSPLMLHTITTRFVGYDGIFFSAIL